MRSPEIGDTVLNRIAVAPIATANSRSMYRRQRATSLIMEGS